MDRINALNRRIAEKITSIVSTMWAAYLFAAIDETHAAALAEFEYAKEARAIAQQELTEIKKMAHEIHRIVKDVESK